MAGDPKFAKLIFSCSGCADVGEIADQTARRLTRDGVGRMFCLASMAAGIEKKIKIAQDADKVLVMDGCPLDCASKTLAAADIPWTARLRMTDQGFDKGESPATPERIDLAADIARKAFES
ncbi:putative zinc-binding protein [Pseudodesulfovibrio tunisiensis]|uniref:putative zinc-binding protein n=1 Tax=Pseudodesulfovibrio tunisiensis TaxID=463192 RepID=UPI001FB1FFDD|nr:putative zinc-binding protein [Pseudodesulfovibrio tunisiensis]